MVETGRGDVVIIEVGASLINYRHGGKINKKILNVTGYERERNRGDVIVKILLEKPFYY